MKKMIIFIRCEDFFVNFGKFLMMVPIGVPLEFPIGVPHWSSHWRLPLEIAIEEGESVLVMWFSGVIVLYHTHNARFYQNIYVRNSVP